MKILREVNQYVLNEGTLQARGLYNLFDTKTEMTSLWFDDDKKESLMNMNDSEFVDYCDENIEKQKTKYTINIKIISNSESGFEYSLDEIVKKIKSENHSGFDENENESYKFIIKKK